MKKLFLTFILAISTSAFSMEKCGSDLNIKQISNASGGSGGPYIGDLTLIAGDKNYEWRTRYGLDKELLNQVMSLAIYAQASGKKVDIYCSEANQPYNARYIVVK